MVHAADLRWWSPNIYGHTELLLYNDAPIHFFLSPDTDADISICTDSVFLFQLISIWYRNTAELTLNVSFLEHSHKMCWIKNLFDNSEQIQHTYLHQYLHKIGQTCRNHRIIQNRSAFMDWAYCHHTQFGIFFNIATLILDRSMSLHNCCN